MRRSLASHGKRLPSSPDVNCVVVIRLTVTRRHALCETTHHAGKSATTENTRRNRNAVFGGHGALQSN
jgi:hypothetical protein